MDRAGDQMQALLAPLLHRLARLAEQDARHRLRRSTSGSPCSASACNIERAIRRDRRGHGPRRPAQADRAVSSTNGAPGTDVEEGHPGYGLYQQNSLRDAVLAGLTFHIFHEHNDRVKMANIAQIVNVLQAMILTDEEKMLLTPTYHVFEMYKVHHDATRLPVELASPDYEFDGHEMPALSVSASRDKDGVVHVSLVNAHATRAVTLDCELEGVEASKRRRPHPHGRQARRPQHVRQPEHGEARDFDGAKLDGEKLTAEIPAHSSSC